MSLRVLSTFTHIWRSPATCIFSFFLPHYAWSPSSYAPSPLKVFYCELTSLPSPSCPVTEQCCCLFASKQVSFFDVSLWLTHVFLTLQDGIKKKRTGLIERERKQREQVGVLWSPSVKCLVVLSGFSSFLICVAFRCSCWKRTKWSDMKRKRWVFRFHYLSLVMHHCVILH